VFDLLSGSDSVGLRGLNAENRVWVGVCHITVTRAKLTHRAIFTLNQEGVDLLLRDFTALSATCGERTTVDGEQTQQED